MCLLDCRPDRAGKVMRERREVLESNARRRPRWRTSALRRAYPAQDPIPIFVLPRRPEAGSRSARKGVIKVL
jgi:hypothetical protein